MDRNHEKTYKSLVHPHPHWEELDLLPLAAAQSAKFILSAEALASEAFHLLVPLLKNGKLRHAYETDHRIYCSLLRSRCRWAGLHMLGDDKRLHNLSPTELLTAVSTDQLNPLDEAIRHEHEELLKGAIRSLPESARQLVKMRYFDELSHTKIAERFDISEDAVNMRLWRIRLVLNHMLTLVREDLAC